MEGLLKFPISLHLKIGKKEAGRRAAQMGQVKSVIVYVAVKTAEKVLL